MTNVRSSHSATEIRRAEKLDDGSYVLEIMRLESDRSRVDAHPVLVRELVSLRPEDGRVEVLISTSADRPARWPMETRAARNAMFGGWDADGSGTIVMVNGRSPGSLSILSIADGTIRPAKIELRSETEAGTRELEREFEIGRGKLPRIGQVGWLIPGVSVIVRTNLAMHRERQGRTWIEVEVHGLDTVSAAVARLDVTDSSADLVQLRSGRVVVVDGASRRWEEYIEHLKRLVQDDVESDGHSDPESGDENTCVRVYDLRDLR